MHCSRCQSPVPEVAHFCHHCGQDLVPGDARGRRRFALQPDEPVASFALISSIMPREAGRHPQTYRTAFTITLVAALVAAIFGAMPIAVLIAAFAIPIVYITYLYDVNLWEDAPLAVTGLAFGLTGLAAILFTALWTGLLPLTTTLRGPDGDLLGGPQWGTFLILAILVPVVGEAIRQVGPVLLASRPAFDDLMDGVTFGVVSGVAYACFDTLVRHWALLTGGLVAPQPAQFASLVFLEGFVKPLVMGTATGLAVAEFSGLGKGFDGFTPRYFGGVGLAIGANVLYATGVYLIGYVGSPNVALPLQVHVGPADPRRVDPPAQDGAAGRPDGRRPRGRSPGRATGRHRAGLLRALRDAAPARVRLLQRLWRLHARPRQGAGNGRGSDGGHRR